MSPEKGENVQAKKAQKAKKIAVGGYYSLRRVLLTSQCFAKLIIFAPAVTAQIILPFREDSFSKKIKMVK